MEEAVEKERRTSARKRSFLQGRIYYHQRRSSVDCLVRDISKRGAKLVFADAVAIPDVVELYLPAKEEMHQIRVQWRKGDEMGIDFIRPEESAEAGAVATPTDLSGRVLKLESECAALKRTLGDLRAEIRKLRGDVV